LQRLLNVEDPAEPTEVVIHVNKLGEGWDVTNLYTIIPLRAANSPNLVEQALGRGLRLPYGRKTGVEAVDRLTVVSHDKFQAIVDHARELGSIVQVIKEIQIDQETATPLETVRALPILETRLGATSPMTRLAAKVAADPEIGLVWSELHRPETKSALVKAIMERAPTDQGTLGLEGTRDEVVQAVDESLRILSDTTIPIPRISLRPKSEVQFEYRPFVLDVSGIRNQPVEQAILLQALQSGETEYIETGVIATESRPENYLVRELTTDPAISYDRHAALLYDLAGQVVAHLRSYLNDDDAVANVLVTQGRALAAEVRRQLMSHRVDSAVEYEATVHGNVHLPRAIAGAVTVGAPLLDFRAPVVERSQIRRMRFGGFKRCLFEDQRFQSDAERRFAVILERDPDETLRWYKPALGDLRIWLPGGEAYNPDLVIDTHSTRYLAEPKGDDQMQSPDVLAKAAAARKWCAHATSWEQSTKGKP
jgi:type III restriction enzyme